MLKSFEVGDGRWSLSTTFCQLKQGRRNSIIFVCGISAPPACLRAAASPPVTNFSRSHVFASRLYRYNMAWHDRNEEYFVYVSVSQYFLSLCWTLVSFADQLRMKQLQLKETYKVYREIQLYQVHISILFNPSQSLIFIYPPVSDPIRSNSQWKFFL